MRTWDKQLECRRRLVRQVPAGHVSGRGGADGVQAVPRGYYCAEGAAAALPCPGGTHGLPSR